jgi:hypothetical protein
MGGHAADARTTTRANRGLSRCRGPSGRKRKEMPGVSCDLNAGPKKIGTIMNLSSGADTHKSESLIPQRSRGHRSPAQSLSVIAQRPRDHAGWVEEAARSGTDSPSMVRAALEMLVAVGIVEQPQFKTISPWDAPPWREAAAEYHRGQSGRLPLDIEPKRLARLRRLTADSVSLERAYYEIGRNNPTPAVTVQALLFSLRRGVNELTQPDTVRRLSALDGDQVKQVCRRVQAFQPEIAQPWSTKQVDALISAWRRSQ